MRRNLSSAIISCSFIFLFPLPSPAAGNNAILSNPLSSRYHNRFIPVSCYVELDMLKLTVYVAANMMTLPDHSRTQKNAATVHRSDSLGTATAFVRYAFASPETQRNQGH